MRTSSLFLLPLLTSLALLVSACSSDPVQTASALESSAKPSARPTQHSESAATDVPETPPQSVFTVDQTARDPFFPKARPVQLEASTGPELALDIPTLLQANLHGIISAGGKSIAYVSNIMLEEGRIAVIPIRAAGQERQVNVRCREVTKDTVVLEVQGYSEPIRLKRQAY